MVSKENSDGVFRNTFNWVDSGGGNRRDAFSVLEKYGGKVPRDVLLESRKIIYKAFDDYGDPSERLKGTATSAFFLHTRRNKKNGVDTDESFKHLDDSTRLLPVLDPKHGIAEEDVELLWNLLPPLKIGEVKGRLGGKEVSCALISIPITPRGLESCNSASERAVYARPRIFRGAEFAEKIGAKVIGLGETLASLTRHGEKLQERLSSEVKITTGHAFTTYFMNEWAKFAAQKLGASLQDSQVTIIGAHGSIGTAMTEMLTEQGVGKLNLHDIGDVVGALVKKARALGIEGKTKITGGNENLREACRGSRIVLVVASAPRPFIRSEHLDRGTFIINDSQPPGITREEAKKADSTTLWVVGNLPQEVKNTFDSGLVGAEWTCLLEVLALEALGSDILETVGPVTPERVKKAGEIAQKLGIKLAMPQSWGAREM